MGKHLCNVGFTELGWHGKRRGTYGPRPWNENEWSAEDYKRWWAAVSHLPAPRGSDVFFRGAGFYSTMTSHFRKEGDPLENTGE